MLVSATAAAKILGQKSVGGLHRKMNAGELPYHLVDGRRRLERDGLEARWQQITRQRIDSPEAKGRTDYNVERAWHMRERRLLAALERRQKADALLYKVDVRDAQLAVALALKRNLEPLPKQIRDQLPHLTSTDEQMIERLVGQVLGAVADWIDAPEG